MDDQPNKKDGTPPEKLIADTPATAELSVAETSVYSESTSDGRENNRNNNNTLVPATVAPQDEGIRLQRSILNHQVSLFAAGSAVSLVAFLVLTLPFSALVALILFVACTMSMFYMAYRILLLELNQMMEGRGIGDYLPASIYQQLTTTSVHEWMMDGSFFLENRYLLLYFIPGTTQEQLDSYLERLPARHQYMLTRPGLGQFLGQDFMQLIMGRSRYNDLLLEDEREDEIIQQGASRQLFEIEEDTSSRGSPANNASLARSTGLQTPQVESSSPAQQPPTVVAPISTDPADVPEEELQQEYNQESDILTEAVAAMTTTYSTMITNAASGYAVQAINYLSPYVIRGGLTVTLGAMGVGVWGWWAGVYHPSRGALRSSYFPSYRSLLSTAVAGVSSAGMMMLFRSVARSAIKKDREPTKDSEEDDEKKK